MSKETILFGLIFLILLNAILPAVYSESEIKIFMYGTSECPHCRNMESFFSQHYSNSFQYCNLYNNIEHQECFFKWLNTTGLPGYVPQIIIIKNGVITSIVIGENTNITFWEQLIKQEPSESVPVYIGSKITTILPRSKLPQNLSNLCTIQTTTMTSTTAFQNIFSINIFELLITIIITVLFIYVIKKKL